MAKFLLTRHAETDYSFPAKWNTPGWGSDLAPLSKDGELQVHSKAKKIVNWKPQIAIVSPTTRTMNTALILKEYLSIEFKVEFDLHEWVPDRYFKWNDFSQVVSILNEMRSHNGEWPNGKEQKWESLSKVKERTKNVMLKYLEYGRVLVICHGGVIWSHTGIEDVGFVETREIEYN